MAPVKEAHLADELYTDIRLQEKALREGKLHQPELEELLAGLPDASNNLLRFDKDGAMANPPERKLKTLRVKTAPPQPVPPPAEPVLVEF